MWKRAPKVQRRKKKESTISVVDVEYIQAYRSCVFFSSWKKKEKIVNEPNVLHFPHDDDDFALRYLIKVRK